MKGEYAENAVRVDFLPSEIDAIRRAMLPVERNLAEARKVANLKQNGPSGQVARSDEGRTRDKIAAFAGISGRTVEKIAAVVEAAERERVIPGRLHRAAGRFASLANERQRTPDI